MALRAYGNWLFCNGGSLHSLRHTLLASQRKYLNLRPFSKVVWELITRWEHAEPPQHRTPIPEPVLKAIVTLAWMQGFRYFAGITLLAFYGLGRIGEVLQCNRGDLLLPNDDLWNQSSQVFLRSSVSATRTSPSSASAYRYRWNVLLKELGLEAELRLTPGGLRGGGAVEAYRKGVAVTEIQWRMRLKHLHTLEFYLQELGAVSALAALNSVASRRIKAAAACYDILARRARRTRLALPMGGKYSSLWRLPFSEAFCFAAWRLPSRALAFIGSFAPRLERLEAEVAYLRAEVAELRALLGVEQNDGYEVVPATPPRAAPARGSQPSAEPSSELRAASPSLVSGSLRGSVLVTPGETDPLQGLQAPEPGVPELPRSQRDQVCVRIGQWIAASLAGQHRGASGRDQIPQGSKVWVVFRTYHGVDWNPPRAFSTFCAAKVHCKQGSLCGEAVFIGLPNRADVLAVCRAAGLP
ncbi:unnamed protein product, partial [Symbiodinium necroappetens]